MIGFLLCASLLAGANADKPLNYAEAHRLATKENRPLLVLVGADWCPACRVLKRETLSTMQQRGKLKPVVFALVDVDDEPELAAQLMRSTTVPQLVLYTPAPQGWYRMYLHGAQAEERIEGFIAQGIELQRRDRAVAQKQSSDKSDTSSAVADE